MPLHSMLATPDVAPAMDTDYWVVPIMLEKVAVMLAAAAPPPGLSTLVTLQGGYLHRFLQPHLLLVVGSGIERSEPPRPADSEAQDDSAAQLPLWAGAPPDAVLLLLQVAELQAAMVVLPRADTLLNASKPHPSPTQ